MCNLYKMRQSADEVARLFGVESAPGLNFGEEVYPGYPGLVVVPGAVRSMTWGFPLALTGKRGQRLRPRPVNNARAEKLRTAFWRDSMIKRRCLIPVSAWAEAEGPPGRMTRTWYYRPERKVFAVAGIWRPTVEWGDAYSMVMVDGCAEMAEVHDRMPVILTEADWSRWLGAPADEAHALCQTCVLPIGVDRTSLPWSGQATGPLLL